MIIKVLGNEINVQRMLQDAMLNSGGLKIEVTYYNGTKINGRICSYKYNHPITNMPPIDELSLYDDYNNIISLDINQIMLIEG